MILKTGFHNHTKDDPKDPLSYSTFELIDEAKKNNYDILAITCHAKFVYKKEHIDYAQQKNILLVPGIEAEIEGKHVVVLGSNKDIEKVETFQDLNIYKNKNPNIFIIASHPFVPDRKQISLGKKLIENINLFDAIELSIFSNKIFNFNKKASNIAQKYNKPLIATSDVHCLKDLKRGYALVDAKEKTAEAVFDAIRQKKVENKMNSMGVFAMIEIKVKFFLKKLLHFFPRGNRN
ncbi:PHP-associated domain-containing protein [Patescibacteria group bacterium]